MAAVRRKNTKPELTIRRLLHADGYRYRVDHRIELPGGRVRPDIVFTRARIAVFMDGCFWHACPEHGRRPTVNDSYWGPKLTRTVQRDLAATQILAAAGWTVLRFWEHQIAEDAGTVADTIETAVRPSANPNR